MPKNATVQRVRPRRIPRPRVMRAEIVTIGPRKALMEQFEARAAINPVEVRVKAPSLRGK